MNPLVSSIGIFAHKFIAEIFEFKGFTDKPDKNNYIQKEKVYIIGNGWAGYYFAKNLDKNKFVPIIIAPNKKVLNTPKLTNILMDNLVVEFANPYGEIILDVLEDIDIQNKKLITKSGKIYPYEKSKVVLSIGSEPNDFNIPGVSTHTYKFKTISDAMIIRDKLKSLGNGIGPNESHLYIVGSGITGIELGSKINKNIKVDIIEGMGEILPGFTSQTKNIIWKHLTQTQPNINIKTNMLVKSIDNQYITVYDKIPNQMVNLKFNKQSDLIIWTGGIRINGYGTKTKLFNTLNKISPIKTPRGIEVCDDFTLSPGMNIYCLGDMVSNKGPPSAQNAKIQGEYLAQYFNSGYDNKFLQSNKFVPKSKGKLVHLVGNTYLESKYYNGFVPEFINTLIEWMS